MLLTAKPSRRLRNDAVQSPAIALAPTSAPAPEGRFINVDRKAGARIPMATPRHVLDGPSNRRPSRISKPPSTDIEKRLERSRIQGHGRGIRGADEDDAFSDRQEGNLHRRPISHCDTRKRLVRWCRCVEASDKRFESPREESPPHSLMPKLGLAGSRAHASRVAKGITREWGLWTRARSLRGMRPGRCS